MFTHLRVASGFSFQYGANHPEALVAAAAERGFDTLALTDRDGVSGVVRFVRSCRDAGIHSVLGVDLALRGAAPRPVPTPAGGGRTKDLRDPRVVVLAGANGGWAALCSLVTAAHARDREHPGVTVAQLVEHLAEGSLVVLLGSDSPVGGSAARGDRAAALEELQRWRALTPSGSCYVAPSHLRAGGCGPGSRLHTERLLCAAEEVGLPTVLTNTVRMVDASAGPTIGVLDAARRLVPLDARHLDQSNAECWLKPPAEMARLAEELHRPGLVRAAEELAQRCRIDPRHDLGLGEIHLPEHDGDASRELAQRCRVALSGRYPGEPQSVVDRLTDELAVIDGHGFASYFLTVATVVDRARALGIRVAARGSGAGSLVNHLLGISGVDPIRHDLLMERFLSEKRRVLPDIDIDVESARRLEIYADVLEHWGPERVAAVAMVETYRIRHAVRDVGAALSMPPSEVDMIAKAFPHISAGRARDALAELPELRRAGLDARHLEPFFTLVESLDGLPRNLAMHPCGIVLGNRTLGRRTPIVATPDGYPMTQFDKDDVEALGLLKLDVLGVRMQSAMAHAVQEIERTSGSRVVLDDLDHDDPATFDLIRSTHTLGCFQIESPGQRELIGKFAPEVFEDLIIDISLFRPGPVKSDMVRPFLEARQGWTVPRYPHPDLRPVLSETQGVVVFHEQVIRMFSVFTGCSLAEGDEARRSLGTPEGQEQVEAWFRHRASGTYPTAVVDEVWQILSAFASFGFCKAHAAAFALPTYQSAWLKAHWPAHFHAGLLTHDPGMYPKRFLLADARRLGIVILGPDINRSAREYRAERVGDGWGVRIGLADLAGITDAEIDRLVDTRPHRSLTEFWHRARPCQPTAERLILTGALDALHPHRTRRDLLLHLADLHRGGRRTDQPALADIDPADVTETGLPELTMDEQVRAELDIFGLDISRHVIDPYRPLLSAVGCVPPEELLQQRNGSEILVAGVKVATQTPPVRSGERVVFLTLDDGGGPVDLAYFADMQGRWASTVFNGWLLLARGVVRRSGPRGFSLRATGCWDLVDLHRLWDPEHPQESTGRVLDLLAVDPADEGPVGLAGRRRVLRHASGFTQSPYADVRSAGSTAPPRALWHASPGSSGPTG